MSRAPDKAAALVGQMCRAISRRKPHWVAVVLFEMYMDETGTHDQAPVTGASAYLARSEQWETFTGCLVPLLDEFGVKVFHATDYETFHGEFEGWTLDKKVAFAKRFFPIFPATTWLGIGNAIVNQDWEDAIQGHDELKSLLGVPYLGCFQRLVDRLMTTFEGLPSDDQIAIFHEDNDFKGQIIQIWDNWFKKRDTQNRLVSLTFGSKRDFVPLQAADALAFEAYKALDNQRFNKGRTRKSIEIMNQFGNVVAYASTRDTLPKQIEIAEKALLEFKRRGIVK